MIKHDPNIREDWIWEDFSEKGLCPEIQNIEDFPARRHQVHGDTMSEAICRFSIHLLPTCPASSRPSSRSAA